MTETQFINLRLILKKHGESSYQAQLEHQSRPDPQPVTFNFALTGKISDNNDFNFSYYFKRLGELKAREEDLDIVGKALYNLVFREDLGSKFEAWHQALTQGERFRLRLDIQAPELISVPWELLRDDNQFLVRHKVSIVRFIGNASKEDVNLDSKKMKVLIVSASPNNNSFDENEYIEPVKTLFEKYGIQLDILTGENATRQGLYKILDENKYDLFHFVGHGTFAKDKGKVIVIDQQGNSESIRGNDLSVWLWNSGVKFAFLCSCKTGITSQENTFNGVAYSLVGTGIPTVVAMQYNFPQEEAKTFVESFYNKLLRSESIDKSMEFARNALPSEEVSWCIPVLYSQSQFNITGLVTQSIPDQPRSEEITRTDRQQLANLLVNSGFCELGQRRTLCISINVDADKLNFFNNETNESFAILLVDHLFKVDKKTSIKLLIEELDKQFQEGKNADILRYIKAKIC